MLPHRAASRVLLLAAVLVASALSLTAQPRLVKDINVSIDPVGSAPAGVRSIGDITYFYAQHAQTGYELWKTDGTEAGTTLVRDLNPGPGSGVSPNFSSTRILGNRLIFAGIDGVRWGFWATDGTAQGTVRLSDTSMEFFPTFGPVIGSTLYYTVITEDAMARELWRTDGTPAGTRPVLDRNSPIGKHGMTILVPLGSQLLLTASDGTNQGLFTTDGTEAGTHFVAPFGTTLGVSFGDTMLFAYRASATETQLMRTDGTSAGTTVVRGGFTRVAELAVMNGVAYFTATDPVNGNELWRSDGTLAGTALVADITPGVETSQTSLRAVLGNRLLLTIAGQLWASDGSAAGTHLLKAVPYVGGGAISGNHFYFVTEDAAYGRELWKTDGTIEGTAIVADVNPGPPGSIDTAYLVARPGGVLFPARDRVNGTEPWITDGTSTGTRMLRNIAPDTRIGSEPRAFANVGGRLVFQTYDGNRSLWVSDGTPEGTSRLDAPGLKPGPAIASGGLYYFENGELPAPLELWRSDGTVPGTFRLFTMGDSRYINAMTALNGGLFFAGSDLPNGAEPWFTDGTLAGTRLLKDLYPGTTSGYSYTAGTGVADESTLVLTAETVEGREVWLTDGTPGGTRRLMRLESGAWSVLPGAFTKFGDAFYFMGRRQGEPWRLWRADAVSGDFAAVRQIADLAAGPVIWKAGGSMLFIVGKELWRSDGTEAGTVRIHDAVSLPRCFTPGEFVVGDGVLYWYAYDGEVPELWRSDGTAAGTFRLGRFPGTYASSLQSCLPHYLHYSGGRLYFIGRDQSYGAEPWVTDGTLMGTRLLWDVNPGPDSSNPGSFLRIGRTLFFAAEEPGAGRELWAMETGCVGECPPRRRSIRH